MSRREAVKRQVQLICQRAFEDELKETAPEEWLTALQEQSRQTLEVVSGDSFRAVDIVSSLAALSRCCVALAREMGLCNTIPAELVALSLSAASFLYAAEEEECCESDAGLDRLKAEHRAAISRFLEPLGEALDSFAVEIFEGLRRLEAVLRPQWRIQPGSNGGRLEIFADPDLLTFARSDVEAYEALQAICVWSLALVVRAVGYEHFSACDLWAFASGEVFAALVFSKAALSFRQGNWEPTFSSVPEDLPMLRASIIGALSGLCNHHVAFFNCDDINNGDISMSVRNESLLVHQAAVTAATSECGLLECLLAHSWIEHPHQFPAFISFLRLCTDSSSFPRCSIVLMVMGEQVERFKRELAAQSVVLWSLLCTLAIGTRDFLRDCAALALVAEPTVGDVFKFIQSTLGHERSAVRADGVAAAALVVVAAAAGQGPSDLDILHGALAELAPEQRLRAAGELWNRLTTTSAGPWQHALTLWMQFLNVPQESCPSQDTLAAAQPQVPLYDPAAAASPSQVQSSTLQKPSLRGLVQDAPPCFRCAIDGELLVDPVRSPLGHVFERSVLARCLQASGGVCPVTSTPLTLVDCKRDGDLRKNISAWIKSNKDQQKLPMMFAGVCIR